MNVNASDSSDDETSSAGGKASKLKIVDVTENEEHPSVEEKKPNEEQTKAVVEKKPRKKTTATRRREVRPKTTNTSGTPRKKATPTGLNGNYWNVVEVNRHANTAIFDPRQLIDNDDDDTTSSSEQDAKEKLQRLLTSTSSSSSSSGDLRTLLYANRTFITCRSPDDSFFLCQVLQDVFNDTKKIRIRWCALADANGDETKIDENTHFIFDYEDTLDPQTILTGIPQVLRHSDKTISLKKQDIFETKRLLEKSIKGESPSTDEPMDLTTESSSKTFQKLQSDGSEDSSPAKQTPPKPKKRKISPESSRKQVVKKRVRITSGEATTSLKRQRTLDISELGEGDKEPAKTKKSPKKTADKPATTPKTQLFKVQSNRLLQENLAITLYRKEPFFEDSLLVPFISSFVQGKLAIRAVLLNDHALLKSLIDDVGRVCSVHVQRGLHNELTAIHYAVQNDNIELLKILLEDLKAPKKDRCPLPTVTMTTQSTGRANIHAFGFHTAQIMAGRGAKEGNNALNKDTMTVLGIHSHDIVQYAVKNNCSREVYELLLEALPYAKNEVYESISHIVRRGHRKLAASIIGDIKDNAFYGFNNLHHQVLLFTGEDVTINRAASVVKKTKDNFQLTPIHCAAINPNSKYLKQLLNIMPEYNILDKYERRPIHFAAACEGPEPLEYLLSKQVSFNDADRGGNSPLHIAVTFGRAINAEILLRTAKEKAESNDADDQIVHQKFGLASINRLTKARFYPLHLAVLNNHLECVKVLLEFGATVDAPTSTSSGKLTPLMLACQKGYLKIAIHLIDNGAKVEARDRFKRTPLIHACMCGNAHIVSHLLRMGGNANACDSSLNTALHYAIAYGWYFCVRLLIEAGANANCVNSWQTTCLAAGFLKGHYGLCDYLLTEHRVDINFKTDDGLTLLDYVVGKHKADCTAVDANGNNAFHYFASNTVQTNSMYMIVDAKKAYHDNVFKIAQVLFDHNCEPKRMNNKMQTPLMIALEAGNFLLVDYLINQAKVDFNSDVSHDGKTLLHYFAMKCDEYDLVQTLLKLPINDELKKMGQMFDSSGRTPFHYCAAKFNGFCQANKSTMVTDQLQQQYQSIVQMIEYFLESVQCDPDAEIRSNDNVQNTELSLDADDEEEASMEDVHSTAIGLDEETQLKPKETAIFSLLRTVPFAAQHPLAFFLKKIQKLNVLHHETQRTPLLEAIFLQEYQTVRMLMNEPSCDINLATSIVANERRQTPFILACRLQLFPIILDFLTDQRCHLAARDDQQNQAIHYYLATRTRSNQYLELLNLFVDKIKQPDQLNSPGKHGSSPLHIAVYHNSGAIDSTTDVEQTLVDHKSDLLATDDLGNIPLHNIFLGKNVGDDPVELCVLMIDAMHSDALDTKNNEGNTPLHLAVMKCSTVCVMLLQQNKANLLLENHLSNSIIGTCIASGHLNLFITFLQQATEIDLGKLYTIPAQKSTPQIALLPPQGLFTFQPPMSLFGASQTPAQASNKPRSKRADKSTWVWKYADVKDTKQRQQHSLICLIIQRDWQGALSLILNGLERFYLSQIQIFEAAISNNKLNLVLRLLLRLKVQAVLQGKNAERQNLFHLLANMANYDESLFRQILLHLHEQHVDWNVPDKYGCYPLHYACAKQNLSFIQFLREKYTSHCNLDQMDAQENTAIGLLFWSLGAETVIAKQKIESLLTSHSQLDCLCTYPNEITMNPLSFGYTDSTEESRTYPPMKSDGASTSVRTSPLINAVVHNNFQMVKFLLQLKADVNFPDEEKRTPLMHAVRQNNIDIVKLLLNADYTLKEKTDNGFVGGLGGRVQRSVPLMMHPPHFFLGATTTVPTIALFTAPTDNTTDTSDEFVVTSAIDFNASDSLGRTCIHHLVQPFADGSYTSNIELLRLLHSSGASVTKHDLAGLSPLQYGAITGCQHLCDELTKLINDDNSSTQAIIERFDINDPNTNLLDRPDFYADAQQLIDKYATKHPAHTHNTAYQVDRLSGMSMTGEVLIDTDKNEPYDVRLTKTDVTYGTHGLYNFYRMQIIKHKSKANLFFLFTRWGRIGDAEGQYQLTPYSTLDECRKEFLKVFREKTGNAWKDTDEFESKPKKYTLIKLSAREMRKHANVPIDFRRLHSEHPASKLQPTVFKDLLRTLINPQAIRLNVDRTGLDVEWMPVSQLKREALQKARDLLLKLKKDIEKKQELVLALQRSKIPEQQNELKTVLDAIYNHTNEYYTIVPLQGYADQKLPVIEDENQLKKQEKILDDLLELELAYKILLGAQSQLRKVSPLDYLYRSMNCQFEAMNKDGIDSQLILRYIWASAVNVQVEQIFKIARPQEDERLFQANLDNHYLLWHGTSICNLISILTRGLLAGPLAATSHGSLFGRGIYTADTFAKSLGYCSGVTESDGNGERCFMILCEVALGKIKEVGLHTTDDDDDGTKQLDTKKFQSRKGVGRMIPDPRHTITRNYGVRMPLGKLINNNESRHGFHALNYNEYIVYDEAQIALRYLVQFRR